MSVETNISAAKLAVRVSHALLTAPTFTSQTHVKCPPDTCKKAEVEGGSCSRMRKGSGGKMSGTSHRLGSIWLKSY